MFDHAELLAPAGKYESLIAAVQHGADAVYLGEKKFSARKNASNFTWEEIKEAVRYCHVRGVKVHLALNTLASGGEIKEMAKSFEKAVLSGIDAVIVQDLGAAKIFHKICPEIPLHASTQLGACNAADVEFLQKHGFTRVVLARELSYNEIRVIKESTDAELEAFVHGALCICFSGRCLMSSFIGGRSGNRGMCAQPCRQLYTALGKKRYFLSPRDLCMAGEISAMKEAGITSFKIEGRMKSPEYVAAVTSVYRKYIDDSVPLNKDDEELLKKIFVRGDGFTKGYFCGINTPELMNYSISNDRISQNADEKTVRLMKKTFSKEVENRKVKVSGELKIKKDEKSTFKLSDTDGNTVLVFGDIPDDAIKVPLDEKSASERMKKMGQTPFTLENILTEIDCGITLSAAKLNQMRRECCELLEKKRAEIPLHAISEYTDTVVCKKTFEKKPLISAQISNKKQFYAAQSADIIIVPLDLWESVPINGKCALLLPGIIFNENEMIESVFKLNPPRGVYAASYGVLSKLHEKGFFTICDFGLNIFNADAACLISEISDRITLSPEMSLKEIENVSGAHNMSYEVLSYGKQAVMVSRACLVRGVRGKCECTSPVVIKDKKGAEFQIFGDIKTHINTVYNSVPTFMADKLHALKKSGAEVLRLVFTDENPAYTEKIIRMYKAISKPEIPEKFTRGYFMK